MWELIKLEVRNVTIAFASKKKKERNKYYKGLVDELNKLQEQIDRNPDDNTLQLFNVTKEEIELITMNLKL